MNKKSSSENLKKDAIVDDGFVARRSTKVTGPSTADGDTWQETLAVCELAGKLTIRSYYSNRRTNQREWDEPPSGASRVISATESMRRMAQIQLQEMQIATGNVPDPTTPREKKKGFFGAFRRSASKMEVAAQKPQEGEAATAKPRPKIQYRADSFIAKTKRESKRHNKYDENLDLSMQKALASSLSCVKPGGKTDVEDTDTELERALALSMAESQSHRVGDGTPQRGSRSTTTGPSSHNGARSRERLPPLSTSRYSQLPHGQSRSREASPDSRTSDESSPRSNASSDRASRPQVAAGDRYGVPDEMTELSGSDLKPDPPAFGDAPDDGSIVHLEFSHDDDEALKIALMMSLQEAEKAQEEAKAALKPEKDLSEMTEEEQLAFAMAESLSAGPPAMTEQLSREDSNETKKMPALESTGNTAIAEPIRGIEGTRAAETEAEALQLFPGTSYVASLNDEDDTPHRSPTRVQRVSKSPKRGSGSLPRSLSPAPSPVSSSIPRSPKSPGSRGHGNGSRPGSPADGSPLPFQKQLNHQDERGRRKFTLEEVAVREEKMLQKALRASVRHLGSPRASAISEGEQSTPTSQHHRHPAKRKDASLASREEKMFQMALRASVRDVGAAPRVSDEISNPEIRALHKEKNRLTLDSVPGVSEGKQAEDRTPTSQHHRQVKRTEASLASREEKMLQIALRASVRDVGATARLAEESAKSEAKVLQKEQLPQKLGSIVGEEEGMPQKISKSSTKGIPINGRDGETKTVIATNQYRQQRSVAGKEERMLQTALQASARDLGPAADNSTAVEKTADETAMPPKQHREPPLRRKLTKEEVAVREEKMLQKAMKASMKANSLENFSSHRSSNKTPEEVLKLKEQQMLEMALRASMNENTENLGSKYHI